MEAFESNRYPKSFVQGVDKRRKAKARKKEESTDEVKKDNTLLSLPYIRGLSEQVARVLRP